MILEQKKITKKKSSSTHQVHCQLKVQFKSNPGSTTCLFNQFHIYHPLYIVNCERSALKIVVDNSPQIVLNFHSHLDDRETEGFFKVWIGVEFQHVPTLSINLKRWTCSTEGEFQSKIISKTLIFDELTIQLKFTSVTITYSDKLSVEHFQFPPVQG